MYRSLIQEATGVQDPKLLAEIEEEMRVTHPTLDGLYREEFIAEARLAWVVVQYASGTPASAEDEACVNAELALVAYTGCDREHALAYLLRDFRVWAGRRGEKVFAKTLRLSKTL